MLPEHSNQFDKLTQDASRQIFLIFLGRFCLFFLGLFSNVILARLLGASMLGHYQMGLVVAQLLSTIAVIGLDIGLIRYIPVFALQNQGKVKRVIFHSILISFIISLVLTIVLFIFSHKIAVTILHSQYMITTLKFSSLYLPCFVLFRILSAVISGLKRPDVAANMRNIFVPGVFAISLLGIVLIQGGLVAVIIARILSYVATICCCIYFLNRKYAPVFKTKSTEYDFRTYLAFSIPLFLSGILGFLMGNADIIMIGYFLKEDQVGIYSVVTRIAMLVVVGIEIVNASLGPNFADLGAKNDLGAIEQLLKVFTKWIFYTSFFIFAIICIFRHEILTVFGASFRDGSLALIILSFGNLMNASTGSIGNILVMTGRQKWEVLNSVCMIIINITLNYMLIPRYAIVGAAIATASSILIVNFFRLLQLYKEFGIHPYSNKYYKGFVAISMAAITAYFLHRSLNFLEVSYYITFIIGILISASIAASILFVLKFDDEDQTVFSKLIKRQIVQ